MAFSKATLNYATAYQRALEQAFPYSLYFGKLYSTPNNNRFRWVNSKTIEIPSISTSGRTVADRDSISTAQRNYNNAWETKTLTNERKWSTLVHPKDIDQTNMVASIANITRVFNEEQKFPEMDAYTISKIYYDWITTISATTGHDGYTGKTANTTALTSDSILTIFDQLMLNMDNARVPVSGRVLYVTNEVNSAIKSLAGIGRTFDVQSGVNQIDRVVNRLDEVEIIPVPSQLMKTLYNFTEGWAVDELAHQINMCLIHPMAVITPVSYTFAQLDPPSALSEGKYYYYEESFEDVFILNKKADAIQFHITIPAASGLTVTSAAGTAAGDTKLTVLPAKAEGNSYVYKAADGAIAIPGVGEVCDAAAGYTAWNGSSDLTLTNGHKVLVVEVNGDGQAVRAGTATVVSNAGNAG